MKSKLQFFKISDFERWHIHNTLTWAKIMNSNSFESPYPWWFPGLLVKNIVVLLRYIIPSQRALTLFYKRKSDRSVMLLIAWYVFLFQLPTIALFCLAASAFGAPQYSYRNGYRLYQNVPQRSFNSYYPYYNFRRSQPQTVVDTQFGKFYLVFRLVFCIIS